MAPPFRLPLAKYWWVGAPPNTASRACLAHDGYMKGAKLRVVPSMVKVNMSHPNLGQADPSLLHPLTVPIFEEWSCADGYCR